MVTTAKKLLERSPLSFMIVKQARCLDSNHFDSNNVMGSVRLLQECLTFLKMITATTGEKLLLQFSDFI